MPELAGLGGLAREAIGAIDGAERTILDLSAHGGTADAVRSIFPGATVDEVVDGRHDLALIGCALNGGTAAHPVLERAYAGLRAGGRVLLQIPNRRSLRAVVRALRELAVHDRAPRIGAGPSTLAEARAALASAGFADIAVRVRIGDEVPSIDVFPASLGAEGVVLSVRTPEELTDALADEYVVEARKPVDAPAVPVRTKTIVASLLPRACVVLEGFARTDVRSIFLAVDATTRRIGDSTEALARATSAGVNVSVNAFGGEASDEASIRRDVATRLDAVRGHPAFRAVVDGLPEGERPWFTRAVNDFGPRAMASAIALVEALDELATRTDVRGVVVSDDSVALSRTLVRWARARGIPSVMLTHGATPFIEFQPDKLLDDHYLYGEMVLPTVLDSGVRPDQVHLGTFFGHLDHRDAAPDAGPRFRTRYGIASDCVVVVLALGFNSFLSALEPPFPWFIPMIQVFMHAVRILRDRGVTCVPLVKHRWHDPTVEEVTRNAARAAGVAGASYFDGPMNELLPATDILCGSDSNTLIEAMMYDVALVNVVYPFHLVIGPYLAAEDGVPYVDARRPRALADALEPLVASRDERARQLIALRDLSARLVHDRSRDVDRIAADLTAILERRRPQLSENPWRSVSPPIESIRAIPVTSRRILDATGSEESAALIASLVPEASVDAAFDDGAYDAVVLGYALARAADPGAVLSDARRALAPGGRALVEFTNARNLRLVLDALDDRLWTARRYGRDASAPPMSLAAMRSLLAEHGFAIERTIVHDEPSLHAIDPAGPGALSAGRLSVSGLTPSELEQLKASAYTLVVTDNRPGSASHSSRKMP